MRKFVGEVEREFPVNLRDAEGRIDRQKKGGNNQTVFVLED